MSLNKIKNTLLKFSGSLAAILIVLSSLTFPKVFADTQTLALACEPNDGAVILPSSGGQLGCDASAPNESPYIAASGTDSDSYPTGITVTVVSVDCGNDKLSPYQVGSGHDISSITCTKGGTPTLTKIQSITSSGQASSCSASQNSALCPYCSENNAASTQGCVDPNSDSATTCNSDNGGNCDLVAKYINPFIDLFSAIFGLLAIISFILGGISFSTSEGDPQKAAKAQQRIFNTVFAVIAYIFLYAFLQFLIPGGLFNK